MKKINPFYLLTTLIVALALILRFYNLQLFPPSLNWDEVSIGYNAYSILNTSKDEWGNTLPLSFKAYGDYKLPGYVYLDVPFVAVFGLNEWGVRLPSALLGIGFVILISLILKELTNIHVRSWAAFLAAITPWAIVLSRIALEAQLALFLTTLGFYLFLLGLKKRKLFILSAVFWGLTIFSYNSSRVVTPLLLITLGIFYWKELKNFKKEILISVLIFLTFFIVALPKALLQDSSARYRWTSILDEGAINRINELRGTSALPPPLTAATYNKVTYVVPEILKNYVSHFDPRFLFLSGGSNYQFSVPGSGMFYP
ncbi:MAG: glycosyl transferase family protein, partial [Microgenomates group bacterium Gr01-1014_93]